MIWLKIDSIETNPVEMKWKSYYDSKTHEIMKPEVCNLKVKIGDTVLEGRQMGTFCVVDDEKLNKVLEFGSMRKEIWEEAYKAGKQEGYKNGFKEALKHIADVASDSINDLEED